MADGTLGKGKDCTKRDVTARRDAKLLEIRAYDRERSKTPERKAKAIEYQRRRRAKPGSREKNLARGRLRYAVRTGKIAPQPCRECGSTVGVQAHHTDYTKPLEVVWLCVQHHWDQHRHERLVGK
jgi:hypothetical protein